MPNKHKNNTISFRPDEWERILIEERARLSGKHKKDFIAHSCIYSNICVVGNAKNIKKIVDSIQEMQYVMQEIASRLTVGDFPLSTETFHEMSKRYIAICLSIIDILDGAAYLFDKQKDDDGSVLEKEEKLKEIIDAIDFDF